jgi:peptidoglycan/LPS O-acetylase OafA/YrhL
MVLAYHAGLPLPGGFTGVDAFFVISGFVITQLLLRDAQSSEPLRELLKRFYSRRVKRLAPALGLMVVVVILTSFALESSWREQARTGRSAVASITIFANLHQAFTTTGYFALDSKTNPLLHVWSLSLEEQFYLVFPILILVLLQKSDLRRTSRILVSLFTISLMLSVIHSYGLWPLSQWARAPEVSFYSPWTRSWEFLGGSLVALIPYKPGNERTSRRGLWVSVGGVGLLVASALLLEEATTFPGIAALLPVLGTSLIIAGCTGSETNVIRQGLSSRWIGWIGDRSYSIYLWHWPFVVFGQRQFPEVDNVRLYATLISIIPAAFSYSLLEMPWRRVPALTKNRFALLALTSMIIPAGMAITLERGDRTSRQNAVVSSATEIESENLKNCLGLSEVCLSTLTDAEDEIVLVGDSHAGSLAFLVDDVAQSLGLVPSIATKPGCPVSRTPVAFYLYEISEANLMTKDDCEEVLDKVVSWARTHQPRFILVALNSPLYLGSEALTQSFDLRVSCFLGPNGECDRGKGPEARVAQFGKLLASTLRELANSTDHLVLVAPLPIQFRDPELFIESDGKRGTPRNAVVAVREPVLNLYSKLIYQIPNLAIWDPLGALCTYSLCPYEDKQGALYGDNTHLSLYGATKLYHDLIEFLIKLSN